MSKEVAFSVRFDGVSSAEASLLAQDLRTWLRKENPQLSVERRRTDPSAMDLGNALNVMSKVADAAALAQLAYLLVGWLRSRRKERLTIVAADGGKVIAAGLDALDQDRLAAALREIADG